MPPIYTRDPFDLAEGGEESATAYGQALKALPNTVTRTAIIPPSSYAGPMLPGARISRPLRITLDAGATYHGHFPLAMQPRVRKPYPWEG